jgi:hypothetical protein
LFTGIVSYFGACMAMGVGWLEYVLPRQKPRSTPGAAPATTASAE